MILSMYRAATIVLRESNCHFLRVDKEDFNRVLRGVEANTVRLKEHGEDVLVLEKISSSHKQTFSNFKLVLFISFYEKYDKLCARCLLKLVFSDCRYTVMAGTSEKMLEHLLETRVDGRGREDRSTVSDPFLDDFLLTHIIFMPTSRLIVELSKQYPFQLLR